MNVFTFNNYSEFAVFFKINWLHLSDITLDQQKLFKGEEFLKFFQNSKGGCSCNRQKREEAVKSIYSTSIPFFFTENEPAVAFVKQSLGQVDAVHFKNNFQDESPFFLI